MKTHPYLTPFSRLGGFAAIFMSLMLNSDNCAQDVQAHAPPVAPAATMPVTNIAECSPGGEYFAISTPDDRIRCGRTHEGARPHILHLCAPRLLVFSPDGRFLAGAGTACGGPTPIIKVWAVDDSDPLCRIETGLGEDTHISFSHDGMLLVTTGEKLGINLWQLPKGTLKWSVTADRPVSHLAISKDGKSVIAIFTDGNAQRFPVP